MRNLNVPTGFYITTNTSNLTSIVIAVAEYRSINLKLVPLAITMSKFSKSLVEWLSEWVTDSSMKIKPVHVISIVVNDYHLVNVMCILCSIFSLIVMNLSEFVIRFASSPRSRLIFPFNRPNERSMVALVQLWIVLNFFLHGSKMSIVTIGSY
jgi:hypothetical protein